MRVAVSAQSIASLTHSEDLRSAGAEEERALRTRELLVVLESLALMLQLLRLPHLAVERYDRVSALLTSRDVRLPPSDWPLAAEPDARSRLRALRFCAAELLEYDIGATRTRVLRNKVYGLELARYVTARQLALTADPGEGTRRLLAFIQRVQADLAARPKMPGLTSGCLSAFFGLAAALEVWAATSAERLLTPLCCSSPWRRCGDWGWSSPGGN